MEGRLLWDEVHHRKLRKFQGANSIAIVKHNLGTAGASVSVESSTNGSAWSERLASFVPSNDKALFKVFTGVSAQYWRIKIVTASWPCRSPT
jgi:hypothetical protein